MKVAIYRGIREFEVTDIPIPTLADGEVLIKVDYCSICGSDLHGFTKGLWTAPGLIMGHEYSGTIVELGPNPAPGVEIGQKVCVNALTPCGSCDACRKGHPNLCTNMRGGHGAFAEYIKVVKQGGLHMMHLLPENVSTKEGSMMEPLSVALRGVKRAKIDLDATVAVFGAGTLGIMVSQVLKSIGAVRVIQIDISAKRLEVAKSIGVDYVINASEVDDVLKEIEKITGPCKNAYGHSGSCDVVFECAGIPLTVAQAQKAVKGGGQLVSIALTETDALIDIPALVQKEVTWYGSYAYVHEYSESIALVAAGKVNLNALITDVFPLDQIHEAFERQLDIHNSVKVILDCRS